MDAKTWYPPNRYQYVYTPYWVPIITTHSGIIWSPFALCSVPKASAQSCMRIGCAACAFACWAGDYPVCIYMECGHTCGHDYMLKLTCVEKRRGRPGAIFSTNEIYICCWGFLVFCLYQYSSSSSRSCFLRKERQGQRWIFVIKKGCLWVFAQDLPSIFWLAGYLRFAVCWHIYLWVAGQHVSNKQNRRERVDEGRKAWSLLARSRSATCYVTPDLRVTTVNR